MILAQDSAGFFDIVFSGGWVGVAIVSLLAALSIAALALAVEHALSIRPSVLAPPELADGVAKRLSQGQLLGASQACDLQPSVLARTIKAALAEADGGWGEVEKALEDTLSDQSARLFRKIEYLSVIANIAPMIGLLGTVIGMIFAFQEVASTQGAARASELASGIYQALVTTVGGLVVAIPALAAFAVFRNRVDGCISHTALEAQRALRPLKLMLTGRVAQK